MQYVPPAHPFPRELEPEAAKHPGGWVYDVDPAFAGESSIPPERIVGAWRIDATGVPTGDFVLNTGYRPDAPSSRRSKRRVILPAILVLCALVIAGVLILVLTQGNSSKKAAATPTSAPAVAPPTTSAATSTSTTAATRASTPAATRVSTSSSAAPARKPAVPAVAAGAAGTAAPTAVRLTLTAKERVWVCVADQSGRRVINGEILPSGTVSRQYVSRSFRVFLGNGGVSFRINGRVYDPAPSVDPVSYTVNPGGVAALSANVVTPCG